MKKKTKQNTNTQKTTLLVRSGHGHVKVIIPVIWQRASGLKRYKQTLHSGDTKRHYTFSPDIAAITYLYHICASLSKSLHIDQCVTYTK